MKLHSLEDLVCPNCLLQASHEVPLVVSSRIPARFVTGIDDEELLEAVLLCNSCGSEYPVIAGVLIVVPNVAAYIRKQFGSIISNCILYGGVSAELIRYMQDQSYNLAKVEYREYYDAPRKLSTYLCGHYDNIDHTLLSHDSFSHYVREEYKDFYGSVLELWQKALSSTDVCKKALDVGCYVGGVVHRLADRFENVYGIDDSFAGILLARQIQIGYPTKITEYDLYMEGDIKQRRTLNALIHKNVDFFVGSALCIPFRAGAFALTTNFNLLELVPEPKTMLRELHRVSGVAAYILLTSPYWWEEDEVVTTAWIGGKKGQETTTNLKLLFEQLGIDIMVELAEVPWILRYNSRAFMTFINAVLVGKVAN